MSGVFKLKHAIIATATCAAIGVGGIIFFLPFSFVSAGGIIETSRNNTGSITPSSGGALNGDDAPSFTCSLYFAPSTIPTENAGWGLYTARDLMEDQAVGEAMDIVIPILDTAKTLPFRGQQRFLPWLAYVWPEEEHAFQHTSVTDAFPAIELGHVKVEFGLSSATAEKFFYSRDDPAAPEPRPLPINENAEHQHQHLHHVKNGRRMNAFSPGIASQANSHQEWDNLYFRPAEDEDEFSYERFQIYEEDSFADAIDENVHGGTGPAGPRSRYRHGGLAVNQFVPAGSELFLFYGYEYHRQLNEKLTSQKDFETLEDYKKKMDFSTLSTERDKRNLLDETTMRLRTDEDAKFENREANLGARVTSSSYEERRLRQRERQQEREEFIQEYPPGRSLDWLEANGICMDQLTVRESSIPHAGKGAFAKHAIRAGQVVSHAPLLHMKRDDLVIYRKIHHKQNVRLDLDNVEGHELLLNYCLGHPDSEILLLPYSPVVNYINHNGKHPNSKIRWTNDAKAYFDMHPIDILEQPGGALRMEYVALHDIAPGEEITIDYGSGWETAWKDFFFNMVKDNNNSTDKKLHFRHEIGVPADFYPVTWLHKSVKYELAPKGDLLPGELKQMVWKHNGEPFTKFAYHLGLPKGFSHQMLEYTKDIGVMSTFDNLLQKRLLNSDEWYVFNMTLNSSGADVGQFFAQSYKSTDWEFNMHYIAAWDDVARRNFLGQIGRAGFDEVMDGIGRHFGLENLTCFHASYMGVSECDTSFTHTDLYATGEVAYNIIWPIMLVNGSMPELNLQADDGNTVISINYAYDAAVLMGDWGYHYTSSIKGYTGDQKRVVVGMYCGQLDDNNSEMLAHLYDGEDPAPFMGQFEAPFEYHWSKGADNEVHRMSRLCDPPLTKNSERNG